MAGSKIKYRFLKSYTSMLLFAAAVLLSLGVGCKKEQKAAPPPPKLR